jgi:hypothetical protein
VNVKIHPVVNVEYLKKYNESPNEFAGRIEPPPPPVIIDGQEEYEVEELIAHRNRKDGGKDYKVKWLNYDLESCTWEAEENLSNAPGAITEYWQRQEKSKTKSRRRR